MNRTRAYNYRGLFRPLFIAVLTSMGTGAPNALAQPATQFPTKPLRLVIPFPPGGGSDIVGRIIGQRMGDSLGQLVVADNRAGAASIIGTDIVAKAQPDGYTLLLASGSHSINASGSRKLPFDALRDFVSVGMIALIPNMLVTHPSLPANTVSEFIAIAKAKGGQLNYGSAGNGSTQHLAMELFKSMAGIDLVHVPYKGISPALADALAGRVQVMFAVVPAALPHTSAGKLRALAISTASRSPLVPNLPTIAESGVPRYDVASWYGVLAPAGTPPPVIKRLNAEVNAAAQGADVKDRFTAMGAQTATGTPEQFTAFVKAEINKWASVVKKAGIEME